MQSRRRRESRNSSLSVRSCKSTRTPYVALADAASVSPLSVKEEGIAEDAVAATQNKVQTVDRRCG